MGKTPETEKEPLDLTRRYIEAGLKLTERDLLRERFIMASVPPPRGERPLNAGENFLADVLADPELAEALGAFIPGLTGGSTPAGAVFVPDNILPWGQTAPSPKLWPDPLAGEKDEAADLLRDQAGRSAALMAGAALAGAAPLDKQYLYTQCLDGRPIRRSEGESFELGPEEIVIPRRADRVLILGFVRDPKVMGMNPALSRLRPFEGWLNWPEQTAAVLKLAAWLEAQGYLALASAAGLVMAAHLGALAGLGELGRQGLLITPEYGPNLRLFSIITDFPFGLNSPASFGIADYCETCQRCINECPAKALAEGRRRPGLYQWPVDRRACFDNWLEKKDPCRKCIEICPYTREPLVGGGPGGPAY